MRHLLFALSCVLPGIALVQISQGFATSAVVGYLLAINLVTLVAYVIDKRAARARRSRLPEKILHLLELLGGWPVAYVTQQMIQHKCSKRSYQVTFLAIILLYQIVALWQLTKIH